MKRIPNVLILLFLCLLCAFALAEEEDVPLSIPEEVNAVLLQNYGQYIIHSGCYIDSYYYFETEVEDPNEIYAFLLQYEDKYVLSVIEKADGQYHLTASNPTVQVNGVLPDHFLLDIDEEPKNPEETVMKVKLSYRYAIRETEFCVTAESVLGSFTWTIDNVLYDGGDYQYTLKWMPDMLLVREPECYEECSEWCVPLMKQFAASELSSFSLEDLLKYLHYDNYYSYIIENTNVYRIPDKTGKAVDTIEADECILCLFTVDTWKVLGDVFSDYTAFVRSSMTAPQIFGKSDKCKVIIPDEAYLRYSPDDVQSAVDALKKYNDSTAGRILWRIEYDDMLRSEDQINDLCQHYQCEKIIIFSTDFGFIDDRYTIGFEDGYARDWLICLGRNGDEPWEVLYEGCE